jgi:hypothetical protein
LLLVLALVPIPCFADSQARVVRLSDVQGDVQIDRNTGQGYEKAFLNLPITQGVKIRTQGRGRAELEFEDGSTLRITPNTVIEVPQLLLRDSGAKLSSLHLQEGVAYVNFFGAKDDEFSLTFAREKLTLTQAAHLRIVMGDADATLAVLKGEVKVVGPTGTVEVAKGHTANFDLVDDHFQLASGVEDNPYDSWDKQEIGYQQRYSSNSYSNYSPYAYGTNDLNYYGSFFSLPGYGMLWQPYFTGLGWDPFMNGAWAFYPGYGYGWVSAYPWGWTPYHCGSWVFIPMYGWVWQPGGTWMGWNTIPVTLNAPTGFVPPRAPVPPGGRIVPVSRGPVPVQIGNKVRIANNSAGLGIPRGSVENLRQLSRTVELQGFVTAKAHTISVSRSGWWNGGYAAPSSHAAGTMGHGVSSASASHSSGEHSSSGHH